jgi:hypothetical protein
VEGWKGAEGEAIAEPRFFAGELKTGLAGRRPPHALPAAHFERYDVIIICETVHYPSITFPIRRNLS